MSFGLGCLLEISEDETPHAEPAFRFIRWAVSPAGPALERAVQREFAVLATRSASEPSQSTRTQAIAQVVLPCSRALFRIEVAPASTYVSAERS